MQLFHSAGSPYARIARMAVLDLGLADRIAFIETTLRDPASTLLPHNPVGRVPSLVLADGTTITETTPILMVLDSLVAPEARLLGDGADGWKRLAAYGRVLGMLDGIAVWNRELRRPVHERSPGVIALEEGRAARIAAAANEVAGAEIVVDEAELAAALDPAACAALRPQTGSSDADQVRAMCDDVAARSAEVRRWAEEAIAADAKAAEALRAKARELAGA